MKRHVGMLDETRDETWEGTRVNLWTKVLMILVFTLYLACTLTEPCIAKPVQLVDYDAQTFFENYRMAVENVLPKALSSVDDSLTYRGETSLYKKYTFRVNDNVSMFLYENKGNRVSFIELKSDALPEGSEQEINGDFSLANLFLYEMLDFKANEKVNLGREEDEKYEDSESFNSVAVYSHTYSSVNERYIHRRLGLCRFRASGNWYGYVISTYSADDAE